MPPQARLRGSFFMYGSFSTRAIAFLLPRHQPGHMVVTQSERTCTNYVPTHASRAWSSWCSARAWILHSATQRVQRSLGDGPGSMSWLRNTFGPLLGLGQPAVASAPPCTPSARALAGRRRGLSEHAWSILDPARSILDPVWLRSFPNGTREFACMVPSIGPHWISGRSRPGVPSSGSAHTACADASRRISCGSRVGAGGSGPSTRCACAYISRGIRERRWRWGSAFSSRRGWSCSLARAARRIRKMVGNSRTG